MAASRWQELRAPDGAVFYFDEASGHSVWATPDDWQWRADPSGRWFMHNRVTGASRWPGPDTAAFTPAPTAAHRPPRRNWTPEEAWSVGGDGVPDWECEDDALSAAASTVAASSAASSRSTGLGVRSAAAMSTAPMASAPWPLHRRRDVASERTNSVGGIGTKGDWGSPGTDAWREVDRMLGQPTPRTISTSRGYVEAADGRFRGTHAETSLPPTTGVAPLHRFAAVTPVRSPAESCGSTPSGASGPDIGGMWGNAAVDAAVDVVAGSLFNLCSCSRIPDTFRAGSGAELASHTRRGGLDAPPEEYATARARRRVHADAHSAEHMDDESWVPPAGRATEGVSPERGRVDDGAAAAEAALAAIESVSASLATARRATGAVVYPVDWPV